VPIEKSRARLIRTDSGTVGGDTYWIKLPGEREEQALCFRRIRSDPHMRCVNVAGYKTDHVGTGACSYHGGNNKPYIVTGAHAVMTKVRLANRIDDYLQKDREELLDLTYHLAATRVIFDDFIENYPDPENEDYGLWFHRFTNLIGTMGTLVEKISKVDARNSLTAAQILYIRAILVDMFMKYIPDADDRERAIRELASRMGGDVEVSMKPSEVPRMKINT
jgi:hypothetical protein